GARLGAHVAEQLTARRDHVEGLAAVDDRRYHGEAVRTGRRVVLGHALRGLGQREQRIAAAVRSRARVGGDPGRPDVERGRGLALDHHALLAVRAPLARLEAQARVEALEARRVLEPA